MPRDEIELTSSTTTGGLSRRRVVGTAAHAAWAAPVIVVASAAPALAMSGQTPAAIVTIIGPLIEREKNTVFVPVTFTNTGGPTTSLVADVQITATVGGINATQPTVLSGAWERSRDAEVILTKTMDVQFSKLDPQVADGTAAPVTSLLEFSFSGFFTNGFLNGNITVTPMVVGAPGSAASPATAAFEVSAAFPQP